MSSSSISKNHSSTSIINNYQYESSSNQFELIISNTTESDRVTLTNHQGFSLRTLDILIYHFQKNPEYDQRELSWNNPSVMITCRDGQISHTITLLETSSLH